MKDSLIYIVKTPASGNDIELLLAGEQATIVHESPRYLEYLSGEVLDLVVVPLNNGQEDLWLLDTLNTRQELKDVPTLVVADETMPDMAQDALKLGATDLIYYPFRPFELKQRITSLVQQKRQVQKNRHMERQLIENLEFHDKRVSRFKKEIESLRKEVAQANVESVWHLSYAANFKANITGRHLLQMSEYSALLARRMGLNDREVGLILRGSPLHDIGKIGIPEDILLKPGKLTPSEREIMKKHTLIGASILGANNSDFMNTGAIIALSHHERWDGKGYPHGLQGEDIPLPGRICALTNAFDALTSKRPYKEAYSIEKTMDIILKNREKQFDPLIVDLLADNLKDFVHIKESFDEDPFENMVMPCELVN